MIRGIFVISISVLLCGNTLANESCLQIDIGGIKYPKARDVIIQQGWQPEQFIPPFELAPFAEWVQKKNYEEVQACAPTGLASCKFVFRSEADIRNVLNVFTQGDDVGVVTGHECLENEILAGSPIIISKAQILIYQSMLNSLGFDSGEPDGVAGKNTKDAILAFEMSIGNEPTGELTPQLIEKLVEAEAERQVAKPVERQKNATLTPSIQKTVPVLERPSKNDGLSCSAGSITAAGGEMPSVTVRSGPTPSHQPIAELVEGDFVFIFEKRANWLGVVYGDEETLDSVECISTKLRRVPYETNGWIPKDRVAEFGQDD